MHLLIVIRSEIYYRFVESIVEEVVRRGGRVTLVSRNSALLREWIGKPLPEGVVFEEAKPDRRQSARLLGMTREVRSYLHWLRLQAQPRFLLDRWLDYIPRPWRWMLVFAQRARLARLLTSGQVLGRALAWWEGLNTPNPNITDQVCGLKPDFVLITPLLYPAAWEIDYLKVCRRLGLPHAAFVASWDNLTSKGIFHVRPDCALVWNEVQVREAVRYHALAPEAVIPVGAPAFDWMFTDEPLQSREDFCAEIGLDPTRPYVVYAVSSAINCGDEIDIVRNLSQHLEHLAPGEIQILVRPHPRGLAAWEGFPPSGVRVGFPPLFGRQQVQRNLFNTLYHAAAIIGLNTSVFLETAILDRPGLALLFRESRDSRLKRHGEFPHFQYLLDGNFLDMVEDEEACAERIVRILQGDDRNQETRSAFVRRFIRPHGLEKPASSVAVDLFECWAPGASPAPGAESTALAAIQLPPTGLRA